MKQQFPRNCQGCGQRFETLRDYCTLTDPLGSPIVYDLELGDLTPQKPIGSLTFSNCRCGSSLVLTSAGMSILQYWRLINWIHTEMRRRGMTQDQLLGYLRQKAHEKVISEQI